MTIQVKGKSSSTGALEQLMHECKQLDELCGSDAIQGVLDRIVKAGFFSNDVKRLLEAVHKATGMPFEQINIAYNYLRRSDLPPNMPIFFRVAVRTENGMPVSGCAPKQTLQRLYTEGKLHRLFGLWNDIRILDDSEDLNYHEPALALMDDLFSHNESVGWFVCSSLHPTCGEHTWLECDGWAIEVGPSSKYPVMISNSSDHREMLNLS